MRKVSLYVTRGLLLASGLLATAIAATILFAPDAFYSGYGIEIGTNVSLANEMKAPMGMLFLAGVFILVGAFRAEFAVPSLTVATITFLSFGLSRVVSMAIDGMPDSGLVGAAVLEIAIGVMCFVDLMYLRGSRFVHRNESAGIRNAARGEGAA